ncbi:MAG: carboxypeptidase-like regulatory domain-containing protein [Terracidiphilus sp.]
MVKRAAWALVNAVVFLFGFAAQTSAMAQTATGEIRGTVTDPTGAVIAAAKVVLSGENGKSAATTSGRDGSFQFNRVQPGKYSLTISANGFASATPDELEVLPGKISQQNATLQLPMEQQQVEVTEGALGVSTSADSNSSAIVIKGKDLDALSDDPDELQSELTALAGPAAGPNGAQIFIDGFTGGQLPPSRRSARSELTRILFLHTTTSWDTAVLKSSPSREPIKCTAT